MMRLTSSHFYVIGIVFLLLLTGCRRNASQDTAVDELSGSDSVAMSDRVESGWSAGCLFGLSFSDSVRFNTPPELPIGYLSMVRKDAVGNFVVGGFGQHVLVFDSLGSFLWSAGQFGEGPGEYSSNYVFDVDSDGTLYVVDILNQRIHEFAHSRDYVRSSTLPKLPSMRNVAVGGEDMIVILNKDYLLREDHPYAILRYSMTGKVVGTWGQMADIVLLQSFLDGGGVAVDVPRNAVYFGYMGDHRVFKTTLEGEVTGVLDSKPNYFIEADVEQLVEYVNTVDRSKLAQTMNNYAVRVSWVTALEVTPRGYVYQQIVRKLARGDDPLEIYLEVWDANGQKLASKVRTPAELLYADDDGLYFMTDIDEPTDKYGVAAYTATMTCPG